MSELDDPRIFEGGADRQLGLSSHNFVRRYWMEGPKNLHLVDRTSRPTRLLKPQDILTVPTIAVVTS